MFRSSYIIVSSDVGGALGASETLGRKSFGGCAFLLFFFPKEQGPQQLSNCCGW